MSTQQDIYAAGSESRPPMLNKENYVPWSSRLLWYAKSRPKGKLIHNFILNGPYVRNMIPEPGDAKHDITVTETFHLQTDDELSDKELKPIEADDQAIQTILIGLPEDNYAAVDSCETTQEIWLRVQQIMKGSDIGIQEKKAMLFNEWERFTSNEGESIESYYHRFLKLMNDLKRNKHFPKKIASNLKFLNNLQPEWSRHVTIVHQTKDFHTANYTQLYDFLKYNQNEVDESKAERLAKTQDPLALMANSNNPYVFPAPHQDQSSFNQNYLQQPMTNPEDITDPTTAMNIQMQMVEGYSKCYPESKGLECCKSEWFNWCSREWKSEQIGNGNLVAAHAEGNAAGQNGNQIRCYNCRGVGHYARNCTVRPRRRDAAYLQTQSLIAQKEEAGIQLQAKEYDLMTDAADLDQIKKVNANCILMTNLQQASTSGTQTDSALVYDTDGSAETDNDVISEDTSVKQGGETVEQHLENFKETRALYESLYQNCKLKETNADMITELARYKIKKDVLKLVKKNTTNLKGSNEASGGERGVKEKNGVAPSDKKKQVSAAIYSSEGNKHVGQAVDTNSATSTPIDVTVGLRSYPTLYEVHGHSPTSVNAGDSNVVGIVNTPVDYTPGMSSYANVTGAPSKKALNFRTLFTRVRNRVDMVVLVECIRAINVNLLKEDVGNVYVWVKLHGIFVTAFSEDGLSVIATKLEDRPKNIGAGEAKNLKKPSQTPRGVSVGLKIERLIIGRKVILVDDEGKPLNKIDSLRDYDSENEVASIDNEMANFLAKKDCYDTNSLLEQWNESYENADYDYDPDDDDIYEGQEVPEKFQYICDNLDIKVRGGKKE
nr:hypothetical protein [Tanacetum cinerariifolium]